MRSVPSRARQGGFTLIEMLTVMTILALVMAVTVASIKGLGGAQKLSSAGNIVADLATQARQNSIAHGTRTALVLVTGSGQAEWDYRLWVLMELTAAVSSTSEATWAPASKWRMLPEGVVVDPSQSSSFLTSPSISPALPTLSYQGQTLSASAIAYQIFLPTGAMDMANNADGNQIPPTIRLVSGRWQNGTLVYTAKSAEGANSPNYYQITLNSFTGIPIIDRP